MITLTDDDFNALGLFTNHKKMPEGKVNEKVVIETQRLTSVIFNGERVFSRGLTIRADLLTLQFNSNVEFCGKNSIKVLNYSPHITLHLYVTGNLKSASTLTVFSQSCHLQANSNIYVSGNVYVDGDLSSHVFNCAGNVTVTGKLFSKYLMTIAGDLYAGELVVKKHLEVRGHFAKIMGSVQVCGNAIFGPPITMLADRVVPSETSEGANTSKLDIPMPQGSWLGEARGVIVGDSCTIIGSLVVYDSLSVAEDLSVTYRAIVGKDLLCGHNITAPHNVFAGMAFTPHLSEHPPAVVTCNKILQGEIINAVVTFRQMSEKQISEEERLLRINKLERKIRKPQAKEA